MSDRPIFDTKLEEGVKYFEQMLKVMPDDRTTLEFLAVVYPQMGDTAKGEHVLAELARVLLKEGDLESAEGLLERLERCEDPDAKAMAVRIRAVKEPKPELVPEVTPSAASSSSIPGDFAAACESEAQLAERLNEPDVAAHLRALHDTGREYLVSALSVMEKEKPEVAERALAQLADEFQLVPVPVDVFEFDRKLLEKLGSFIIRTRGVLPFARIGDQTLVAMLSPHDTELRKVIGAAFDGKVRFFLAEPRLVESVLEKLYANSENRQ